MTTVKRVANERDSAMVADVVLPDMFPSRASACKAILLLMADGMTSQESLSEATLLSKSEVSQAIEVMRAVGIIDDEGVVFDALFELDQATKLDLLNRVKAEKPDCLFAMYRDGTTDLAWGRMAAVLGDCSLDESLQRIVLGPVVLRGETVSGSTLKTVLRTLVDCGGVEQVATRASLSPVSVRRALEALEQIGLVEGWREKRVKVNARAIADFRPAQVGAVASEVA
jgi:DNA-binding transcriptional ArsR family regulator